MKWATDSFLVRHLEGLIGRNTVLSGRGILDDTIILCTSVNESWALLPACETGVSS